MDSCQLTGLCSGLGQVAPRSVLGTGDYLSKPINPVPLREALRTWGGKVGRARMAEGSRQGPGSASSFEGLRASCDDDPKMVREMLELTAKRVPIQLKRLEAAIVAGDGDGAAREAHDLKGAFLTVGGVAPASACQELISLGEDGHPAAFEEACRLLRDRWEIFEKETTDYLATLGR